MEVYFTWASSGVRFFNIRDSPGGQKPGRLLFCFSPNRDHWIQRAGSGMGKERFSGSAEPALSEVADEPQQGGFSCPIQLRPDFQRHLQCLCWQSVALVWSEIFPTPNVTDKCCVSADSEPALPEPFSSLPGDLFSFAGVVMTLTKWGPYTQTYYTGRRQQLSRLWKNCSNWWAEGAYPAVSKLVSFSPY